MNCLVPPSLAAPRLCTAARQIADMVSRALICRQGPKGIIDSTCALISVRVVWVFVLFNGRVRNELMNINESGSLTEARVVIVDVRTERNTWRPDNASADSPPPRRHLMSLDFATAERGFQCRCGERDCRSSHKVTALYLA